ncbi:HNH endonuclease [Cellulophaga phage phi39:1]|uniref:HNH endonuclease n=1 Tax=Cellulophaga phage phi39:1 TaxID=1327993 RepID=UPI000351DC21|nr:HNH endonuclease [Cellulophaga phage phi39:1]AGO49158.1 HNH endonuclease domain protein [Cellulophaga phage phi39:1]
MANKPAPKKKPWQNKRVAFGRRTVDNSTFYNSTKWRRTAAAHKEMFPFCIECKKINVYKAVEFTDHIVRVVDGGDKYNFKNLQSLCKHHHNSKSGKEAHINKQQK